jgi:hypothetical protein
MLSNVLNLNWEDSPLLELGEGRSTRHFRDKAPYPKCVNGMILAKLVVVGAAQGPGAHRCASIEPILRRD